MIIGGRVKIRDKRLADAVNDYAWQTDTELNRLDATELLTVAFPEYLSEYARELRYPTSERRMFAIETLDGVHIGNCVYYGINESNGEAELGIMIGNRHYWDKGYGVDAVATLLDYVFRETNLDRIYLKTLVLNGRAQRCFQKCGFTPYRRITRDGYDFILMEIHRKKWEEQQTANI